MPKCLWKPIDYSPFMEDLWKLDLKLIFFDELQEFLSFSIKIRKFGL